MGFESRLGGGNLIGTDENDGVSRACSSSTGGPGPLVDGSLLATSLLPGFARLINLLSCCYASHLRGALVAAPPLSPLPTLGYSNGLPSVLLNFHSGLSREPSFPFLRLEGG